MEEHENTKCYVRNSGYRGRRCRDMEADYVRSGDWHPVRRISSLRDYEE